MGVLDSRYESGSVMRIGSSFFDYHVEVSQRVDVGSSSRRMMLSFSQSEVGCPRNKQLQPLESKIQGAASPDCYP